MKSVKIKKKVRGSGLYSLQVEIENALNQILSSAPRSQSGILNLFNLHTSSALLINESWDDSAKRDLEKFFDHLAPYDLPFIEHTLEGPDDSPAHMKSALLQQNIALIVEEGQLLMGQWQGVFLAEFREAPQTRTILIKYQPD
ncbi:MAG: hypothetical protein S4CHLAM7_12710 [Chlamydiae bacterium]|nr:hypothetical protein [Chlamydiota bacterium]